MDLKKIIGVLFFFLLIGALSLPLYSPKFLGIILGLFVGLYNYLNLYRSLDKLSYGGFPTRILMVIGATLIAAALPKYLDGVYVMFGIVLFNIISLLKKA